MDSSSEETGRAPAGPVLATYRLQLRPGFGFEQAAELAGYLAELGVSHVYASPYLQAAAGSTHGYDVVDPTRVNRELGGAEAHRRLCQALGAAGLGQVLDVVPNHMAITGRDNTWWWDVLENGPSSVYATYFDVDWDPPESKLRNTVLLPILGDHYGRVLEAGDLRLVREGGGFVVRYYEHTAPVAPRSLDTLLAAASLRLPVDAPSSETGPRAQLESIATALGRLPPSWATDGDSVRERHRDKEVLRQRLAELCDREPQVAGAVDTEVATVNADRDRLDTLLERQNYRLAWWRTAGQELDYRRFFDIASLVGVRVEDDQVFSDSHALVLRFLEDGVLDGVRIDHIDGLRDPASYLGRLHASAPRAWIVVEKILEPGESLPPSWPVDGTTGYDWMRVVGGLAVDPSGAQPLLDGYAELTGEPVDYDEIVYRAKCQVMADALATDVSRLTALLATVCERHRRYRDFTDRDLREAVTEILASFPVYRTYGSETEGSTEADASSVAAAVGGARRRRPDLDAELLAFVTDLLLLRWPGAEEHAFALRFQQVSGPVMAKGVEDCAFYRYVPLLSLNEVGGDPTGVGVAVDHFHEACARTQELWPATMLATSTHDTKRSEDVRARISVLSEIAEHWVAAVRRWSDHNGHHRVGGWPDANTEWLLYQTLVGVWPIDADRAAAYMEKATREAKAHTSWTDPVAAYDEAVRAFTAAVLDDNFFVGELAGFVSRVVGPGRVNSLAQKLLTLTAPGVPDLYQGSELWDLSLVDPDNRRAVDFDLRRRVLAGLSRSDPATAWARDDIGAPKLRVVTEALRLRREQPERFGPGRAGCYRALAASGPARAHVVAFARGEGAATVVPRLVVGLERAGGWRSTTVALPPGRWRNRLDPSGGTWSADVALAELLARFPVALLSREVER
jgi:(1->4)-alpha-D-glucan 1-alpha-D-glucosylmutase